MARTASAELALLLRQAEVWYTTGPAGITLQDAANEFNIPLPTIKRASRDGGWDQLRREHQESLHTKIMNQVGPKQLDDINRVADKAWHLLELGLDRIKEAYTSGNLPPVKSLKEEAAALRSLHLIASSLRGGSVGGDNLGNLGELDEDGNRMPNKNRPAGWIQAIVAFAPQRPMLPEDTDDEEGRVIDEPSIRD